MSARVARLAPMGHRVGWCAKTHPARQVEPDHIMLDTPQASGIAKKVLCIWAIEWLDAVDGHV